MASLSLPFPISKVNNHLKKLCCGNDATLKSNYENFVKKGKPLGTTPTNAVDWGTQQNLEQLVVHAANQLNSPDTTTQNGAFKLLNDAIQSSIHSPLTTRKSNFKKWFNPGINATNLRQYVSKSQKYLRLTKDGDPDDSDDKSKRHYYKTLDQKWYGSLLGRVKMMIAAIVINAGTNPNTPKTPAPLGTPSETVGTPSETAEAAKRVPAAATPAPGVPPGPGAPPPPPPPPAPGVPPATKPSSFLEAIRKGKKLRKAQPTKKSTSFADGLREGLQSHSLKHQETTDWSTLVKFSDDTGMSADEEKKLLYSLMNLDEQKAVIPEVLKRGFALRCITLKAKESASLDKEQKEALDAANKLLGDIKSGRVKPQPSKAATPKRTATPPAKKNFVTTSYIKNCIMAVLDSTNMKAATKLPIEQRLSDLYVNGNNNVTLETKIINDHLKKLITDLYMRSCWTANIRSAVSHSKTTTDACKAKLKAEIEKQKGRCNPSSPLNPMEVLDRIEKVLYVLCFGKGDLPTSIGEIQ